MGPCPTIFRRTMPSPSPSPRTAVTYTNTTRPTARRWSTRSSVCSLAAHTGLDSRCRLRAGAGPCPLHVHGPRRARHQPQSGVRRDGQSPGADVVRRSAKGRVDVPAEPLRRCLVQGIARPLERNRSKGCPGTVLRLMRQGGRLHACVNTVGRTVWLDEPDGWRYCIREHDAFAEAVGSVGLSVGQVVRRPFVEVWATRGGLEE